ncbi:MAG: DMT family transporter [Betaproteobacteria bacterium]|nr:DMT family transporter [Betaproteobacteria bacterium]
MHSKRKVGAVLGLLTGAVTWGLIWYPLRLLDHAGFSGELCSLGMYAVSAVLGLASFRRRFSGAKGHWGMLAAIGITAGWANLAYVLAVLHGEIMRVLLLFYLAPLWTMLFARLLLHERLTRLGYLVMLLSVCGAVTMLWAPRYGLPMPRNGAEWLGLSAGIAFALTNVLTRRVAHLDIYLKSMAVWMGAALMAAVPVFLAAVNGGHAMTGLPGSGWLSLAGLGAIVFVATVAIQFGLSHSSANQAIVILLFELVVAAISSYLLAHELMTLREWVGGTMIVGASLFSGCLVETDEQAGR